MKWSEVDPEVQAAVICIIAEVTINIDDRAAALPCSELKVNMHSVAEGLAGAVFELNHEGLDNVTPVNLCDKPTTTH